MRSLSVLVLASGLCAMPALAADSYKDTQYVSGKAGFGKKIKGTLVIEKAQIRFLDKEGREVFAVPMAQVHKTKHYTEEEEVAGYPTLVEEFLELETRTEQGAEAIVFKTKPTQSIGMGAKIDFYRKEAAAEPVKQ